MACAKEEARRVLLSVWEARFEELEIGVRNLMRPILSSPMSSHGQTEGQGKAHQRVRALVLEQIRFDSACFTLSSDSIAT